MFVWGTRRTSLLVAALMIGLIAWSTRVSPRISRSAFFISLPCWWSAPPLSRWEIAAVAAICAWLAEAFDEFPWGPNTGLPRDLLYFAAFFCMGLFMHEVTRSRKLSAQHMRQIED